MGNGLQAVNTLPAVHQNVSHLMSIHSFSEKYILHNLQVCDLYDVLNLHIIYILFVIHEKESVCGIYPFHQGGLRYSETLKRT